jgi:hypothetical protein
MLDTEERNKLQAALEEALAAHCRAALSQSLPPSLVPLMLADGDCRTLIRQAIQLCENHEYQDTPPSICYFLTEVRQQLPTLDAWVEALEARLRIPPPNTDPFKDLIIRGDIPFLDRDPLRTHLRKFLQTDVQRPILVINGPSGCGKTFTFRFIDHLCRRQKNLRHCVVAIGPDQDSPNVYYVARELMTQLGGRASDLTPRDTNNKRWPSELANDVWAQLSAVCRGWAGRWIFLLDGFSRVKTDPEIKQFIGQLAILLRTGIEMHRHRLVLTDFDESLLAQFRQDMSRLPLPALSIAAARAEILLMLGRIGRNGAAAKLFADEIIAGLGEPLEDLSELGSRCEDILQSILV